MQSGSAGNGEMPSVDTPRLASPQVTPPEAASRPGSAGLAAPAPSPVPPSPQPCASPDLSLQHRSQTVRSSGARPPCGRLQADERLPSGAKPRSAKRLNRKSSLQALKAGQLQRHGVAMAHTKQAGSAPNGAAALSTYTKLTPAAPAAGRASPSNAPPQLRHGKTVRELGRDLIKHHVQSQHCGHSGAAGGSSGTLFYEYDIGDDGLPVGMQNILDAYTRIAGDVEKLTSIPKAPLVSGGSRTATPRHGAQPGSVSVADRARFARVPRPAQHVADMSARSSQRAYSSAPASASAVRVPNASAPPVRSQHGAGSLRTADPEHARSGSFGLSSVLSSQHVGDPAAEPSQHAPDAAPAPGFGLASILKHRQAQPAGQARRLAPRSARQGPRPAAGGGYKAADSFDEGSWIYIMGSSTNSLSAKRLAQRQRMQQGAHAQ